MYTENICLFVPFHKDYHSIHTLHFVLENKPHFTEGMKAEAMYKMYYVRSGNGVFHIAGKTYPLSEGDVFFTFPAVPFRIEFTGQMSYIYISFLGSRGNMILEKLKISSRNPIFRDCHSLGDLWESGLSVNRDIADWVSESILLYTFSYLGNRLLTQDVAQDPTNRIALTVQKYIDDNFSDATLSLETLSRQFSYNKKYLSSIFKSQMKVGIVEYLNTVRIQNACTLIEQGFSSVNDIAMQCGFSDPQYFSKVFRAKMGGSPSAYIKGQKTAP